MQQVDALQIKGAGFLVRIGNRLAKVLSMIHGFVFALFWLRKNRFVQELVLKAGFVQKIVGDFRFGLDLLGLALFGMILGLGDFRFGHHFE